MSTALAVVILLVVLAIAGLLIYQFWFSSSSKIQGQQRTIEVEGTGTVNIVPDRATINVSVETTAATVAEATQQNNQRSENVLDAVRSFVENPVRDVRTTSYYVSPIYPPQPSRPLPSNRPTPPNQEGEEQQQQPIAYRVNHSFAVVLRSTNNNNAARAQALGSLVGNVIDAATEAGANSVSGPSFEVSEDAAGRQVARALAVANAQSKADQLATLAGVVRGPLIRISESSSFIYGGEGVQFARAVAQDQAQAPITPGSSEVTYRVSASYAIQ